MIEGSVGLLNRTNSVESMCEHWPKNVIGGRRSTSRTSGDRKEACNASSIVRQGTRFASHPVNWPSLSILLRRPLYLEEEIELRVHACWGPNESAAVGVILRAVFQTAPCCTAVGATRGHVGARSSPSWRGMSLPCTHCRRLRWCGWSRMVGGDGRRRGMRASPCMW